MVEGKKEEEKGTLGSFGSDAREDEELGEYDREVGAELDPEEKKLNEKMIAIVSAMNVPDESKFYAWLESKFGVRNIAGLDLQGKRKVLEEMERGTAKVDPLWHHTVEIDEGLFSFREEDEKLLCKNSANGNVYELKIDVPDCSCPRKDKSVWCPHLKAAAVGGYKVRELPVIKESGDKTATAQKQIEIEWGKIPVQMLIPKLKKALEYTCEMTAMTAVRGLYLVKSEGTMYITSINYCECENWVREGSSINPCKHMIRVKYSDEEIQAKLKELGADDLPMKRKKGEIAVSEPSIESGMMIRGMTPRLAEVGKIKIGEKSKKMVRGHLPPKKWDHFKIATLLKDDAGRLVMDDKMNEIIGEKCTSLDICLCYDDLTMNMPSSYSWFAQSKLVCMGNGQTAMRKKEDGSEEEIPCNPKECIPYKEKKCNPYGRLSVILASANRIGGVYVLRTRGWNTIRNVLSSMAFIRKEAGGVLAGLPLRMRLLPMTVTPRDLGFNVKIYAVNLEYPGTLSELKQAGREEMERRLKFGINMKQTEEQYRESVKERMKEEAEDEAGDIAEEFAPEGG